MATVRPDSLQRLFSTRELFRGQGRWALLWSVLAAIFLVLLLIDLFLIADLLESAGEVRTYSWAGLSAAAYRRIDWLRSAPAALALLAVAGVLLALLRILMLSLANRAGEQAGLDAATRIRRAIHRQSLRLGPGDLLEDESRRVLDLFTIDADRVRDGVSARTYGLTRYPVELAALLGVALSVHWLVTLQSLIPLAVIWYALYRQRQHRSHWRTHAQARADEELRLLAESLRKTRLVRGYAMEGFEHERFQTHLERFRQNVSAVQRGERLVRWGSRVLIALGVAIVVFRVGIEVLQTPLPLAGGLLLWSSFAWMVWPLDGLAALRSSREAGTQAADHIDHYLERIPDVGQAVGAKFLQPLSRAIQYENVRYSLPNRRRLLDGFDLKIAAGTNTAFISLDPLESRAAAYLLPRFIEPQSGRVLFDGEDIAWVTLESLRAETAYVGGADPFFTGTVRENIACGDPKYSLSEITEAAKQMHANKFILRLPQGYETVLGEHGEQLDPGQAFRLGLARAALRNPAVLILEEPTEPLDDDTKALLDDAYTRLMRDRTIIFIPARLSTVKRADRIVLIHRGRVEALGTHADLVRDSALYRHWEYLRFNPFRQDAAV